jgi:hypothetical protein
VVKTDRAISNRPVPDTRSHFHNSPGDLVAENLRWADDSLPHFLDVCAADTAGADANEDFAFQNFRYRNVFDDDSARASIHTGPHDVRYL